MGQEQSKNSTESLQNNNNNNNNNEETSSNISSTGSSSAANELRQQQRVQNASARALKQQQLRDIAQHNKSTSFFHKAAVVSSSSPNSNNNNLLSDQQYQPLSEEEIPLLPIVSHFTYAVMCEWVYGEAERRPLPSGWKVLLDAKECYLDREGYYAAAFINDSLRSVVVAQRGTTNAEGMRAGVWVFFEEQNIQFYLAAQFSKLVRLRLQLRNPGCLPEDDGVEDPTQIYTISYTGHSLGSVLAACRAVEEHTFAVTFESPGCKKFVAQTMHPFKTEEIDIDIITYLRNPNPVNSLKPHCGFLVQLPSEADDPKRITNMKKATSEVSGNTGGISGMSTARTNSGSTSNNRIVQQQQRNNNNTTSNNNNSNSNSGVSDDKQQQQQQQGSSAVTASQKRKRPFGMPSLSNLWSTQDFLRVRLLEAALPDVQQYLTKLEPVIRELIDYTAQSHSISAIVNTMERGERTHQGQQIIIRWPENLLQFVEYYNIVRELNLIWDTTDNSNRQQLTHALSAYKLLLSKLWQTEFRPEFRIPIGFLNMHSRTLLQLLGAEDAEYQLGKLPLTKRDLRVLATVYTESGNMVSTKLSAFQMKQYLAVITQRAKVRAALERWHHHENVLKKKSKL
jgi:hypothetical protein